MGYQEGLETPPKELPRAPWGVFWHPFRPPARTSKSMVLLYKQVHFGQERGARATQMPDKGGPGRTVSPTDNQSQHKKKGKPKSREKRAWQSLTGAMLERHLFKMYTHSRTDCLFLWFRRGAKKEQKQDQVQKVECFWGAFGSLWGSQGHPGGGQRGPKRR